MGYKLYHSETFGDGIQRIILEEIDKARAQLKGETDDDRVEAIHDARKRFKKVRAALRLIRCNVSDDFYKSKNYCFRDAGRQLSPLRDAQVFSETLDILQKESVNAPNKRIHDHLQQKIREQQEKAEQHFLDDSDIPLQVAELIKQCRQDIEAFGMHEFDAAEALQGGFKRTYKKGRRAFGAASENPSDENLHEWRKRVKDLWYHGRILQPVWPRVIKAYNAELKVLSDLLGIDHDLAIFRQFLIENPDYFENESDSVEFFAAMELLRERKQTAAFNLGWKLYAESPKSLARRINEYWKAWRLEVKATDSVGWKEERNIPEGMGA